MASFRLRLLTEWILRDLLPQKPLVPSALIYWPWCRPHGTCNEGDFSWSALKCCIQNLAWCNAKWETCCFHNRFFHSSDLVQLPFILSNPKDIYVIVCGTKQLDMSQKEVSFFPSKIANSREKKDTSFWDIYLIFKQLRQGQVWQSAPSGSTKRTSS